MAIADQDVGPTVVIKIEESASPSQILGVHAKATGEGVVADCDALDAVLQERDGVTDRDQPQLGPSGKRSAVVGPQVACSRIRLAVRAVKACSSC